MNERALDNSDLLTDLTTMDLKMRDAHPSRVTIILYISIFAWEHFKIFDMVLKLVEFH